MSELLRPLAGLRVGLSVSESEDLETQGFSRAGRNRLVVGFVRALLSEGATLAFGHDWRQDGIMEAVCRAALDSFGVPGPGESQPLLLNLLPWPDDTWVDPEVLARLRGVLRIERAGLPEDLGEHGAGPASDSAAGRYVHSRGLTHHRRRLTEASQARICIGGKERGFAGRYPGILEEAFLALAARQPIYLVGLLGGASRRLGQAVLEGLDLPPELRECPSGTAEGAPLADLYEEWDRSCRPHPQAAARTAGSTSWEPGGSSAREAVRCWPTMVSPGMRTCACWRPTARRRPFSSS